MGTIILWFAGSKVGRVLAAVGALLLAVGVTALQIFSAGKRAERSAQDRAALEAMRDRQRTEDQVARLPRPARADRLKEWSPRD